MAMAKTAELGSHLGALMQAVSETDIKLIQWMGEQGHVFAKNRFGARWQQGFVLAVGEKLGKTAVAELLGTVGMGSTKDVEPQSHISHFRSPKRENGALRKAILERKKDRKFS